MVNDNASGTCLLHRKSSIGQSGEQQNGVQDQLLRPSTLHSLKIISDLLDTHHHPSFLHITAILDTFDDGEPFLQPSGPRS